MTTRSTPDEPRPWQQRRRVPRIGELLRTDAVGGALLVLMAGIALLWANSPAAESYFALRDLQIGYAPWHLQLSVGAWASDGLLAVFFFLVGLELKREFVAGSLRRPGTAILPICAAVGGVVVPALIYLALVPSDPALRHGWAIPTATDIAFAVAVLALVAPRLPVAVRVFLLTLAVVDDLIAIGIIAIGYTERIAVIPLILSLAAIALYGVVAQRYQRLFSARHAMSWVVLLPLGALAWALMHASGVHATVAGVLLGFTVPVFARARAQRPGPGLAEELEYRLRPLSSGFAVPVFAFFAAGVSIGGPEGLGSAFSDPLTIAIVVALVAGKPVGVLTTTWILSGIPALRLDPDLRWPDLIGVGFLAGVGFTVSLLVAELSFAGGSLAHDHAKVAILSASVLAATVASIMLAARNRRYRASQTAA